MNVEIAFFDVVREVRKVSKFERQHVTPTKTTIIVLYIYAIRSTYSLTHTYTPTHAYCILLTLPLSFAVQMRKGNSKAAASSGKKKSGGGCIVL